MKTHEVDERAFWTSYFQSQHFRKHYQREDEVSQGAGRGRSRDDGVRVSECLDGM